MANFFWATAHSTAFFSNLFFLLTSVSLLLLFFALIYSMYYMHASSLPILIYKLSSILPFGRLCACTRENGRECHNIIAQTIKTRITSTFCHEFTAIENAVLILFHYLNIVLLNLCLVCCSDWKKSRVFIIFIVAIINDWCMCMCVRVRVKIYTFDFFCLITQWEKKKNKWQKYCLFARSSWVARPDSIY